MNRSLRALTVCLVTCAFVPAAAGGTPLQHKMGDSLPGLTPAQLERFEIGKLAFNRIFQIEEGLGPVFNQNSCASCHNNPVGGSGTIAVTRYGFFDAKGGGFDPLTQFGGSLRQSESISQECAEVVPPEANIIVNHITPSTLGYGLIEAIVDADILDNEAGPPPGTSGRVLWAPTLENPAAALRPGRFGWKAQLVTILSFSGGASLNEIGITNRIVGSENDPNGIRPPELAACDMVDDPEDGPEGGIEGNPHFIDRVTDFQRFLAAPPQTPKSGMSGESTFNAIGCADCHIASYTTMDNALVAAPYDGGDWTLVEPGNSAVVVNGPDSATVTGDNSNSGVADVFAGLMVNCPVQVGDCTLTFTLNSYTSFDSLNWDYPAVVINGVIHHLIDDGTIVPANVTTSIFVSPPAPPGAVNNSNTTEDPISYVVFLGAAAQGPYEIGLGVVSHDGTNGAGIAEFGPVEFTSGLEDAIAGKTIRPYSDFLLHEMGLAADFIEQGDAQMGELRTPTLWGVRVRDPIWHDGRVGGGTLADRIMGEDGVIDLHNALGSEAQPSAQAFLALSQPEKDAVVAFLDSLGRAEFDHDGDNDVDGDDLVEFIACFTGPGSFYTPDDACAISDFDQDGDVDCDDYQDFELAHIRDTGYLPILTLGDFVGVLLGTETSAGKRCVADMDKNGENDALDVDEYIAAVLAAG